jgi:hypothetical protein
VTRLAHPTNSLLSGKVGDAAAKIHRSIRCASYCPVSQPRPRQRLTEQSAGDVWPAPRTGLSGVPRGHGCNGRFRQKRKKITHCSLSGGASDCPVCPWTEGNYCLPNGAPTAPRYLGAIKGTPRRMEQYTKHLLNILRHRDLAFVHLIHCVRYSSTFLSCNSVVLLSCARSRRMCVLVLQLSLLCVFLLPPYSCAHSRSFVKGVRDFQLWRFLTKGYT